MEKLAVVKVGGSVITDKTKNFTVNTKNIDRVASALKALYSKGWSLVVIHGGGSFGHPVAAAYNLNGKVSPQRLSRGFAEIRYWMTVLNTRFTRKLLSAGVPASPLQTSAIAFNRDGELCRLDTRVVYSFLEIGAVPVLYGDVVVDTRRGASILSGDDVAARLSVALDASRLVYVMGAGGVYDRPPSMPGARLLREISPESRLVVGESRGVDVTQGLRRKLLAAFWAAQRGVPVAIGGVSSIIEMVEGGEGEYTRIIV